MRWSSPLWLAALLLWMRCRAGGGEQQHLVGLTNRTGDGRSSDSAPLSLCTYTFILPEVTGATQPRSPDQGDSEQRTSDSLLGEAAQEAQIPVDQRIQHLELAMNNYTHWIQQVSGA